MPFARDQCQAPNSTTERMSKAADEQNLDAAALAYVQLTLNCVDCHKHVRDEVK